MFQEEKELIHGVLLTHDHTNFIRSVLCSRLQQCFSLGVVFYEALTGELPLGRFGLPSQKVQLDVRLDEVVMRALEKEPERRYQKVDEMKTNIDSVKLQSEAGGEESQREPEEASPTMNLGGGASSQHRHHQDRALCKLPILGLLAPIINIPFFIALGIFLRVGRLGAMQEAGGAAMPGAIVGLLVSTWLGIWGILRIQRSAGKLYGMPLAVAVGFFLPIFFLATCVSSLLLIFDGTFLGFLSPLSVIAVFSLVYWAAWQWATKTATPHLTGWRDVIPGVSHWVGYGAAAFGTWLRRLGRGS